MEINFTPNPLHAARVGKLSENNRGCIIRFRKFQDPPPLHSAREGQLETAGDFCALKICFTQPPLPLARAEILKNTGDFCAPKTCHRATSPCVMQGAGGKPNQPGHPPLKTGCGTPPLAVQTGNPSKKTLEQAGALKSTCAFLKSKTAPLTSRGGKRLKVGSLKKPCCFLDAYEWLWAENGDGSGSGLSRSPNFNYEPNLTTTM